MFKKAERRQVKLRLALCGVSGSGKSYSALRLAKGLGEKIAVIDTENGSGELYTDVADYEICLLHPPFSPARYIEAIHAAERYGFDVLVIDSLSHAWSGSGGVLDMHDNIAKTAQNKNTYFAWREVTPQHNALIDTILQSPLHIIATMRSKTAYEVQDRDGKKVPVKIGLEPVQRAGMEYEFTTVLDLIPESNFFTSSKDRTGIFKNKFGVLTEEHGQQLIDWLNSGKSDLQLVEDAFGPLTSVDSLRVAYLKLVAEYPSLKTYITEAAKQYKEKLTPPKEEDIMECL